MQSGDVPEIYYQPQTDTQEECLIIRVDGFKTYRRYFRPGGIDELIEWGWVVSTGAIRLVPEVEQ